MLSVASAFAQNPVHRCVGKDGNPVFGDQPCESMGAISTRPPPASGLAGSPAMPTPGLLCAKDIDDLRQGIAQAFATRDANRIGGLMLWNGYGSNGAVANIRQMDALVRQPLVSLEGDAARGLDAVTSGGGNDPTTRRTHFGISRQAGCLWLQPPG